MSLILTVVLALAQPSTGVSPEAPHSSPAPATAPAVHPATARPEAASPAPGDEDASLLDQLQQVYQTSCGGRGYGAYDDVCNQLADQIRQAERAARRKAAHKPPAP